ncbi:MAG: tRNA pseudouridine(38-40) synthase TruA [Alphaproteobacteria bacterium]|nr:MAG: tRNA pseudouridine(38-40) synthase TruA [Alphaproteobacteria bacterium]
MTRYKLTLEYDGAAFVGWQRQDNGPSVQEALEAAVAGFCGETVNAHAAGRTDAGVHALAQVAHIDLAMQPPPDPGTVRDALNAHLRPAPVAVLAADIVPDDFHARFSAKERAYLYRIINRRAPLVLERGRAWRIPAPLDAEAMAAAARLLVGRHDFTSFRARECQASSALKTLDVLEVVRTGTEIRIEARARSFLHNQVRIIVGTLYWVGTGKWQPADVARALAARERAAAGPTAPPEGLYFLGARY